MSNMSDKDKVKVMKAGMGAIAQVSEYTAKGLNNDNAIYATQAVTKALKDNNKLSKMGAEAVAYVVGAGALGTGAAGSGGIIAAISSTAVGSAAIAAAPAALVVGVGGLAVYGLYKVLDEHL